MNLFEKLGLVEAEPVVPIDDEVEHPLDFAPPVEAFVDVPSSDLIVVQDVFAVNGLNDTSNTVYKIRELRDTLPNEMPTKTKQVTVKNLMGALGLDVGLICEDAAQRISVLSAAEQKKNDDLTAELKQNNETIEGLRAEIEKLQARNTEIEKANDANHATIEDACALIKELTDFVSWQDGDSK